MKENLSVPNQKEYYYQKQLLKLQTEAYLKRKEAQHKLFSLWMAFLLLLTLLTFSFYSLYRGENIIGTAGFLAFCTLIGTMVALPKRQQQEA